LFFNTWLNMPVIAFTHLFIHSFNKCLFSAYSVDGFLFFSPPVLEMEPRGLCILNMMGSLTFLLISFIYYWLCWGLHQGPCAHQQTCYDQSTHGALCWLIVLPFQFRTFRVGTAGVLGTDLVFFYIVTIIPSNNLLNKPIFCLTMSDVPLIIH
jgi:hypothetical protein